MPSVINSTPQITSKINKFPPRPVKSRPSVEAVCKDNMRKYPVIMAYLAK